MSTQLIADFTTQFAAMAAVNKLLSCGLGREHVAVRVNGSVGRAAAGASTTTTVISDVDGQSPREDGKSAPTPGYPVPVPRPAQFGQAQVTVALDEGLSADDVRFILELAGAQAVHQVDETFVSEDARVWPCDDRASEQDVERAIAASRAGESLSPSGPK